MTDHYATSSVSAPQDVPDLPPAAWNATDRAVSRAPLGELFAVWARRTPTAPALVADDHEWSFGEVERWANRLAHHLIGQGVGPERVVALVLPRSAELVVAELAVAKAGGAYLPIDPAHPEERRAMMLADARPVAVLDDPARIREVAAGPGPDHAPGRADLLGPLFPEHPAYVIDTSGSTGGPKGVLVPHAGLGNFSALCGSAAVPPPPGRTPIWSTGGAGWPGCRRWSCPPTARARRCAPLRARCAGAVSCPPSWWRG
ncbi:D-alanine--D-alanyl carrier protein ligase [Streptomyces antimycoticus]